MSDPSTLIPRSVLFGNPERTSPSLSPDGSKLAWIAPEEGVLNVWVRTIGGDDERVVTHDRTTGIRMYFWSEDSLRILYLQDRDGDENYHLYAVDLTSGESRDLGHSRIDLDVRDPGAEEGGRNISPRNRYAVPFPWLTEVDHAGQAAQRAVHDLATAPHQAALAQVPHHRGRGPMRGLGQAHERET